MITEYTTKDAPTNVYLEHKHNSSGYKATIMEEHDRSRSNPTIIDYTAKEAPVFVTLNVNANNS